MRTSRPTMSVAAAVALLVPVAGCTAPEGLDSVVSATQKGDRATADADQGPVRQGNVKTCDEVGLEGSEYGEGGPYAAPRGVLTLGEDDGRGEKRLDIESVGDGYTVSSLVLNGGPAARVYVPGEAGVAEQAPWEDLQAPLNRGGNRPAIGHWFACVTGADDITTDDTTTTDTTAAAGEVGADREFRTISLSISDGELVRGPEDVVSVEVGQPIRLVITSDETHEVTIPDFDAKLRVSAGEPGTLEFTADESGTSTVELEGAALFKLRVS